MSQTAPTATIPVVEIWLWVAGYEGLYQVSDQGRVRSADRWVKARGQTWRPGRILKPNLNGGYLKVSLARPGERQRNFSVHHLVLMAFAGPKAPGQEALHGPGGALDNRLVNLSWGTHPANMRDKMRDGTQSCGETCASNTKLTADLVRQIRQRSRFETQVALAREFGVAQPTISNICTGTTWAWA